MSKTDNEKSSSPRLHTIVLLTRKKGMSVQEFDRHWLENHAPIAMQVPHVLLYKQHRVVRGETPDDNPSGDFGVDGFAEFIYDSKEGMEEGWASEAGQRAMADVPNFLERLAELVLETHVIVDAEKK